MERKGSGVRGCGGVRTSLGMATAGMGTGEIGGAGSKEVLRWVEGE